VCLNAAPAKNLDSELEDLIDILVVNAVEAQGMGSEAVDSLESAAKAAEQLCERYPVVVVTAGGHGVAVCTRGESAVSVPPVVIDVVSTHGAGDVFTGTLCAELAAGHSLLEAVQVGNQAAARAVAS